MQKPSLISFKPFQLIAHAMPLKLAMIILPPLCVTCVVLYRAGVPWTTTALVAAALLVFVAAVGICDRFWQRPAPWQEQPGAEAMATATQQVAVLGLDASAITSLPAGAECSVCLAEVEAEGDGEAAARLRALVPRRVHRLVAAFLQDVPGVPDSRQRGGGGGCVDRSGGCHAHSGQLN